MPISSKVTIQHSSDDEEMKTINEDEKKEETMNTIEKEPQPRSDSALHEFSYEGRKFFVRLNQFVSDKH